MTLPRASSRPVTATRHEQHLVHRADARGQEGQIEALLGLKGVLVGGRHRIESLYAVGGEGAVYLTRDLRASPDDPARGVRVAKIALLPLHRPFSLGSRTIREQREALRIEATYLQRSGSRSMPRFDGVFEFSNPLLDPARGDAFAESEPVLVMEKLKGCDLDRWLARTHRSGVPQAQMKRTLDRISVVLLQGLVDLYDRGFLYADLRPANLRILGRPDRFVRLLDAGSLVAANDRSGRFPHVPSYLPPELFRARTEGKQIVPTPETQAVMAGRTLYEVATGLVPHPGEQVEFAALRLGNVSPVVGEVVEGLCTGSFAHVRQALKYLEKRAQRRVHGGNDPVRVVKQLAEPAAVPAPEPSAPSPPPVHASAASPVPQSAPVPMAPPLPAAPTPAPVPAIAESPAPRSAPAPIALPSPAAPVPAPVPASASPAAPPPALPLPLAPSPVPIRLEFSASPTEAVSANPPSPVPRSVPAPIAPLERAAPSPAPVPASASPPAPRSARPVPFEFVPPSPDPVPARAASQPPRPASPVSSEPVRPAARPVPVSAASRTPRPGPAPKAPPPRDPMPTPRQVAAHLEFTQDRVKTPKLPRDPVRVPTVRPKMNGRVFVVPRSRLPWWQRWFSRR